MPVRPQRPHSPLHSPSGHQGPDWALADSEALSTSQQVPGQIYILPAGLLGQRPHVLPCLGEESSMQGRADVMGWGGGEKMGTLGRKSPL